MTGKSSETLLGKLENQSVSLFKVKKQSRVCERKFPKKYLVAVFFRLMILLFQGNEKLDDTDIPLTVDVSELSVLALFGDDKVVGEVPESSREFFFLGFFFPNDF